MEHNLKNRPKTTAIKLAEICDEPFDYHILIQKWFEGFEKELRQKETYAHQYSAAKLIKEILGE